VAPSIHKKLAITSPTSRCRLVGIVRSWTQTMEFIIIIIIIITITTTTITIIILCTHYLAPAKYP
jgi:hypothetical protein